jgi:hypothetical protein
VVFGTKIVPNAIVPNAIQMYQMPFWHFWHFVPNVPNAILAFLAFCTKIVQNANIFVPNTTTDLTCVIFFLEYLLPESIFFLMV